MESTLVCFNVVGIRKKCPGAKRARQDWMYSVFTVLYCVVENVKQTLEAEATRSDVNV
jgi:hypothetical protein